MDCCVPSPLKTRHLQAKFSMAWTKPNPVKLGQRCWSLLSLTLPTVCSVPIVDMSPHTEAEK